MTNNIEKLYELAGMGKKEFTQCCSMGCFKPNEDCYNCEHYEVYKIEYPPFTDTKQLELIKWIVLNVGNITIFPNPKNEYFLTCIFKGGNSKDFSQALSGLVCELWEDLTDEQKAKIKRILE